MNLSLQNRPDAHTYNADRILIFLFFLVGVFASYFGFPNLPDEISPRFLFGGLLGLVLLLSTSCAGFLLLPMCTLVFGAYTERAAMTWCSQCQGIPVSDLNTVFCSMVLVPVFFLAAIHGLNVSSSMMEAVQKGSPTAREVFRHEMLCLLFLALLGCAAIFYFY